jgi:WD40 repeat protein
VKDLLTLRGDPILSNSVAFSPDGRRLATASRESTAKVWDTASGKELLTLRGHAGHVDSVAFSPDGKRLATAGADGTVQIYALDIQDLLNLARKRVTRPFTPAECQRYFSGETCPTTP